MHPSLRSREQDLELLPKHQRLLSNLGILAKSQAHASLLASTIRQGSNDHANAKAPANVHSIIARSAVSDIDREAERKYGERKTALVRQRAKRAACESGGNGGAFSKLHSRLKSVLKDGAANAEDILAALRKLVSGNTMAKSQPGDYDVDDFMRDLRSGPVIGKPTGLSKTIAKTHSTVAKVLGVKAPSASMSAATSGLKKAQSMLKSMGFDAPAGASSLGAGYGSDSATLTGGSAMRRQSLDKSRVFGTTVAGDAVKLTPAMIERAASAALAAGQITGAEANTIATYLAMGAICPEPLLKRLRGEA